jgi:hypothetical protein
LVPVSAVVVLLLGFAPQLAAQTGGPSIGTASPAAGLNQGETVTIAGARFGAFGGQVLSWDDFETSRLGADVHNLSPIHGFTWKAFRGAPGTDTIQVVNTRAHSGGKSLFLSWDAETINGFGWGFGGDPKKGPYSKLYISYWRYYTGTYVQGQHNHKAFYVYGSGDDDLPQAIGFIPAADTRWGVMSNQNLMGTYSQNVNPTDVTFDSARNGWHRWDYWFAINATGSFNGVVWHLFDQAVKINRADYKFRSDSQTGLWNSIAIGHMGQGMLGNLRQWYDDVYIATTRARVELCSGSSWSSRGRCEIQFPTAWADTSITIRVNQGAFSSANAYLYVVDANGNPSNGIPVAVSQGGSSDEGPGAPVAPTAVRVIR